MIKDNALANRLNAVKGGQEIPKPVSENNILAGAPEPEQQEEFYEVPQFTSVKQIFLSSLINFAEIAIMSFFYGFGIRTLMSQDWNVLGIFGVGLLANQIFSLIANLKLFK